MKNLVKLSAVFMFAFALSFPANLLADDHPMDEGSDSKQTMKPKPMEEGSGTSAVHDSKDGDHGEYKDKHAKSKDKMKDGKDHGKGHEEMKDSGHGGGMEEGSGGSKM